MQLAIGVIPKNGQQAPGLQWSKTPSPTGYGGIAGVKSFIKVSLIAIYYQQWVNER